MNKILLYLITALFLSCNSYKNKSKYEVTIGETVNIYYSTNSCCYYCITNEGQLKHVSLITDKMIDPGPDDCGGCNTRRAYVFKANTIGIDTIKLDLLFATDTCRNNNDITLENYIIHVK